MPDKPCPYHRGLFIVCVLLACCVFPLVIVGAGVTSKGAGMAFPDWPTSAGHLVNPPAWWQQENTRWEHGHRLIGWTVGMLAIAATAFAWRRRPTIRWATRATLLAIVVQGVLGGLRVTEVSTLLAMLHGIWGQVCFTLACVTALLASRGWYAMEPAQWVKSGAHSRRLAVWVVLAVFLQLGFGAALRHFKSDVALACHLVWLVIVCFSVGWLTLWIMGAHAGRRLLVRLTQMLAILLTIQLILGSLAFLVTTMPDYWSPMMKWLVPSGHVALGALILASSAMVAATTMRQFAPARPPHNRSKKMTQPNWSQNE
ncbi:MAG: heme A synthase [Phycisphaerae bacterium]